MKVISQNKAKLIHKRQVANGIFQFEFAMIEPQIFKFLAGQYISLKVAPSINRPYSILSSPLKSGNRFSLLADLTPGGPGSRYLEKLKEQDIVSFRGPMGNFTLPKNLSSQLYFIATGTGISPLNSMIETLILQNFHKEVEINLVFGARYKNSIIFESKFRKYVKNGKINEYRIYLSRENIRAENYEYGRVTQYISTLSDSDIEKSIFLLCGLGEMIREGSNILKNKGAKEDSILYERY